MALTMRGYSPAPPSGFNAMGGMPAASRNGYPGVQEGYVGAPGGIPMGFMEQGPMTELGPSLVPGAAGFYQPQPPRPAPRYRDFSRLPVDDTTVPGEEPTGLREGKEPPFPVKLHKILSNPEFQEYITWLPHGRSWRVLKPKAFEEKVIPLYFRHAKYASFMRQVNGWGFKRMTQGPDHNSYYHEMFLRGLPHLCSRMRRSSRTKHPMMESDTHPDFYRISMFAPLPGQQQETSASAAAASGERRLSGSHSASVQAQGKEEHSTEYNKTGDTPAEPTHVSSTSTVTENPSLGGGSLHQQILQNQQTIDQNRLTAKTHEPTTLRKDVSGIASPAMGAQLPPDMPPMQIAMGHPGMPALPMAYGDPMAAQAQYDQHMFAAGGPPGVLMPMSTPNHLVAFHQNQALQNQALLAQIQAQMIQVQDQLPDGSIPGNPTSLMNPSDEK